MHQFFNLLSLWRISCCVGGDEHLFWSGLLDKRISWVVPWIFLKQVSLFCTQYGVVVGSADLEIILQKDFRRRLVGIRKIWRKNIFAEDFVFGRTLLRTCDHKVYGAFVWPMSHVPASFADLLVLLVRASILQLKSLLEMLFLCRAWLGPTLKDCF